MRIELVWCWKRRGVGCGHGGEKGGDEELLYVYVVSIVFLHRLSFPKEQNSFMQISRTRIDYTRRGAEGGKVTCMERPGLCVEVLR